VRRSLLQPQFGAERLVCFRMGIVAVGLRLVFFGRRLARRVHLHITGKFLSS
jgi:hypothetical protein